MATVADFIVERLYDWGVRRLYGYPGDGINGMFGALNRADGKIEFVQVRHEEMAAFMACAHAKFTGELGVCIATSGPGASHLVTGLYDARMDHMPVLAIAGQQARAALGGHYQQELDLSALFKDVAGAFVQTASVPAQARHLVDRAVRTALANRTVVALVLPNDLQELDYEPPKRRHGTVHSGIGYTDPQIVPYEADLRRAADVLNAGSKVAMLVGAGALRATDEVIAVADRLGAGVAKALLGKAAVPDELPWVTGSIGLLGTEPSYRMMSECDTLLVVGSGFPYSEFLPKEGEARGVQIDLKADMLSLRYPMEVNLVGDSAQTLRRLLPLLNERADASWRAQIARWNAAWWNTLDARARVNPGNGRGVNPQRAFTELSPHQVTWEQRVMEGDPKFDASQQVPDVPYHRFAELIGLKGVYVDDADQLGAAWEDVLAANRPAVLEVKCDPEVPPLPPHVTLQQAKHFAQALMRGDPRERSVIVETAKQVLSGAFSGRADRTRDEPDGDA